ncbi:MAG: flagellar biosynthetic protein FliO [Phycisphaeraceae bacterium]
MRRSRNKTLALATAALTLLTALSAPASADRLATLAIQLTEPGTSESPSRDQAASAQPEATLLAPTESLRSDDQPLGTTSEQQQPLPTTDAGQSSWWLLETAAALGCVIALIFIARWGYQKISGQSFSPTRSTATVEVLSRTTVAPRSQVLLLRIAGRVLVCADSPQGMNCLSEISDPSEVAQLLGRSARDPDLQPSNTFNHVLAELENDDDDQTTQELSLDRAREDLSRLLSRVRNRHQPSKPSSKAAGGVGGWVA